MGAAKEKYQVRTYLGRGVLVVHEDVEQQLHHSVLGHRAAQLRAVADQVADRTWTFYKQNQSY